MNRFLNKHRSTQQKVQIVFRNFNQLVKTSNVNEPYRISQSQMRHKRMTGTKSNLSHHHDTFAMGIKFQRNIWHLTGDTVKV